METKNLIEIIKNCVHIAMNKKLVVEGQYQEFLKYYYFSIEGGFEFSIYLNSDNISIHTKSGKSFIKYSITDRDDLELRTLVLSVKEYNKDMVISEIKDFISSVEVDHEIKDINDLDD